MTTLHKPSNTTIERFHAFLVQPSPGFHPQSWQDQPTDYRLIQYLGSKQFRGQADTWRFLHNRQAILSGDVSQWAIYIELSGRQTNSAPRIYRFIRQDGKFDG